jgi:glycosyltransferase involved in cell wall biosynthesis
VTGHQKVFLNDFIAVRGRSGSSRGSQLIEQALSSTCAVIAATPKRENGRRLFNLLQMVRWDFITVVRQASRANANVVVHCTNTGNSSSRVPSIVVVHDTMVLDHANLFDRNFFLYAKLAFGFSVRRASLVVTPSHHSKRRILAHWPKANVQVIPWPAFAEHPVPRQQLREPKTLTVLVVSSIDRHKRLPLAIEVVANLRKKTDEDYRLTMVVRPGNDEFEFRSALEKHDAAQEWTEVVTDISDVELQAEYGNSYCLLVSSLDEGFCLPALEASLAGIPVIHAGRGALPEVVPRELDVPADPGNDGILLLAAMLELQDDSIWRMRRDQGSDALSRFGKELFAERWRNAVQQVARRS